ncbi:MAG: hypothetical protein AB7O44_29225 [Hyphomicrobiaceae bacterium]
MADDTERLIVALEARIRDFEKNMEKAERTGSATYRKLQDSSRRATAQMEADMLRSTARINTILAASSTKIGAFAKSVALSLAGAAGVGIGIPAAINAVTTAITDLARIGDQAKSLGITAEAMQELQFAAQKSKVSVDALSVGLTELNKRADEFALTGKGPAAEAFQRIGMSRAEVKERLADPAAMLGEIINRVGTLNSAARVRVLDNLLGGNAGTEFLKFLAQGKDGLSVLRQEARDAGAVLSSDVIERASEIEKRFGLLTNTVGIKLKGAIVEAADAIDRLLRRLPNAEVPVADIGRRSLEITREIMALEAQLSQARATAGSADARVERNHITLLEKRIQLLREEDERLRARGAAAVDDLERRQAFDPSKGGSGFPVVDPGWKAALAGAQARIDMARLEEQALGMTTEAASKMRFEQELLNDAKRRDLELSPQQRAEVAKLAAEYGKATASLERAREAQQRLEEVRNEARSSFAGFVSDLSKGVSAVDALTRALTRMADKLVEMASNSLFDSIFGKPGSGMLGMFGQTIGESGIGSGGTTTVTPALFHQGGVVGRDGSSRSVPASVFAGAQRFHRGGMPGLRSDEVAAILQRGEIVLPKGMGMGKAPQTIVQIINNSSAKVESRQEPDGQGGRRTIVQIDEMMAAGFNRPGSQSAAAVRNAGWMARG